MTPNAPHWVSQRKWDAVRDGLVALAEMDRRERLCGLPNLADQDRTWTERAHEIKVRADNLATFAPMGNLADLSVALDALLATVLATKMAVQTAEETRIP
jgi:hypothetical protein